MKSSERILFTDTEGTGVKMLGKDKIFGISYATNNEPIKYIDVRSEDPRPFLEEFDKCDTIVAHGTKFDAHALKQLNIDITTKSLDCTIVREQLLDEHKLTYDLDSLTGQKLDIIKDLAGMFGGKATKNVQMPNLHRAPREFVERYAIQDIEALRSLYHDQEKRKVPEEVHALEKGVLKALIKMEQQGTRVDIDRAERAIDKVGKIILQAQKELDQVTGRKGFNANSTPQMRDYFVREERKDGKFTLIDGTVAERTKAGGASLNAEILEEVNHPAAKLVLKVRKYAKVRDTFLISQIMGHNINGRVHPWFNQTRVVTGRLSCTEPNMQAVPKRDPEMKKILRPLFLPEDGHTMARFDYDQSDVRGFAHYILGQSSDPDNHPVLKAYNENPDTDFHTFIAEMLNMRRNPGPGGGANAKQINLAMIFNMGGGKLAKQMGLPYFEEKGKNGKIYLKPGPEAEEVFYKYHSAIPGAADMGKMAASVARSRGFVKSIAGRHLRFPDKRFCYKASGYLYQSFTADLIKKAMVATSGLMGALMHLQIHDELVFSINNEDQIWAIKEAMQSVFDGLTQIPIRTQPEIGTSWGETSPMEGKNDQ